MMQRKKNIQIRNPRPKKQSNEYVYDPASTLSRKRRDFRKSAALSPKQKGLEEYLPVQRIDETEFADDRTAVGI